MFRSSYGYSCVFFSHTQPDSYTPSKIPPHPHPIYTKVITEYKAIPGPGRSRRLRLPEFLDSRLMKVARLSGLCTGRFYPPEDTSGTHFCERLSRPQGHSVTRRIMSMRNPNYPIGNRTRDLPSCRAVTCTVQQ